MRLSFPLRLNLAVLAACAVLTAQVAPPRVIGDPPDPRRNPRSCSRSDRPRSRDNPLNRPNRELNPAPNRKARLPQMRRGSPIAGPSSCPTPR